MTLIVADGFDTYPATLDGAAIAPRWGSFGGDVSTVAGMNGQGQALQIQGTNSYIGRGLPGGESTFIVGFSVYRKAPTDGPFIQTYRGTVAKGAFHFVNGALVWKSSGINDLGSSLSVPVGVWTYVEIRVKPARFSISYPETGVVDFRINGSQAGLHTGVALCDSTADFPDSMRFLGMDAQGILLDNFVFMDTNGASFNDFIGPVSVRAVLPAYDTATNAFVPASGTDNHSMLDEIPHDGDTSYVSSGVPGARDLYAVDATQAGGDVLGVIPFTRAKDVGGGGRFIKLVTASGTTVHVSAPRPLNDQYGYQSEILEVNPITGVAWTAEDLAEMKFGFENP